MMRLSPSKIVFSQDSINNRFDRRCNHRNQYIGTTLDALCEGRCRVEDLPTISVCKRNGKWTTADNRRLWVFKQLHRLGKCETIPVEITSDISSRKLTSRNGGRSVDVRGDPGGFWHRRPFATRSYSPPLTNSDEAISGSFAMAAISEIMSDSSVISHSNDTPFLSPPVTNNATTIPDSLAKTERSAGINIHSDIYSAITKTEMTGVIYRSLAKPERTDDIACSLAKTEMTGVIARSLDKTERTDDLACSLAKTEMTGAIACSLTKTERTDDIACSLAKTDMTGAITRCLAKSDRSKIITRSLAKTERTGALARSLAKTEITGVITRSLANSEVTGVKDRRTLANTERSGAITRSLARTNMTGVIARRSLAKTGRTGAITRSLAKTKRLAL